MYSKKLQCLAVPPVDISKRGVADADGLTKHGFKYGLNITGRAADNLEYLRRRRLLLQRLREVSGALAEVVGALAQLVQQSRILDGDDGLLREVLDQLDLLGGERADFLAIKRERTDQFVLLYQWSAQDRSHTPKFDSGYRGGCLSV